MNLESLENIQTEFKTFLKEFGYYICSRCHGKKLTKEFGTLNEKDAQNIPEDTKLEYGHHIGEINKYLTSKIKLNKNHFDKFFNDTEHGFFHGLMTAFICFIINKDKQIIQKEIKYLEQYFASCLLHDFLKCNDYKQEEHDIKLKNFYDKLLPETFIHSNPTKKFINTHLVNSDRLELRRYKDYNLWVDNRFKNLYKNMNTNTLDKINMFYEILRPTLLYLYTNKNETYLRHGIELVEEFDPKNKIYPNEKTYWKLCPNNEKAYPIEIDSLPFALNPYQEEINYTLQQSYCSNHDGDQPWNRIKGFISFKDFKKYKGSIIISNTRDHLYAESNININKWIFLYQNNTQEDKKIINSLINEKQKIISQEIVFIFFKFIKLLQDRLIVLNC